MSVLNINLFMHLRRVTIKLKFIIIMSVSFVEIIIHCVEYTVFSKYRAASTASNKFQPIQNAPEIATIAYRRCSLNQMIQLGRWLFFTNKNIFHHWKLEIASAIPASNDEK